jgi:PIF1-like helicase
MGICGDECDTNCDRSSHTGLQVCSIVWTQVKDTLPKHVQDFARNVEILRKSKDDTAVDMAERTAAASAIQVAFDPDLDDAHDMPDEFMQMNGAVDDDTLRLSYHLTRQRWAKEDQRTATALERPWNDASTLSFESFTPMTVDSVSGIRQDVPNETLDLWSDLIKSTQASSASTAGNAHTATGITRNTNSIDSDDESDDCDSNADDEYAVLEPILTFDESTSGPQMEGLVARLGQNPSPSRLANLISEVIPLNAKQRRTVCIVFYYMLKYRKKVVAEDDDQLLLYVAGEGGTGKSWIIEAVRIGMKLLGREQEVLVTAPTGNAAKNVQGNTIHTGLDVGVHSQRKRKVSQRVRCGRTRTCWSSMRSAWSVRS